MGHWLVIDLEATTDDGGWPVTEMEIIEIGASLVTREGREVDHFQCFVKPKRRPQLTPFCRELTHISQADVDAAACFKQAWAQFEGWLGQQAQDLQAWVSWGDYDRRQLLQEWHDYKVRSILQELPHINLKQRFAKARHLQRPAGLNSALQLAGLQFTGQQHRALEDARNTARLLPLSLPVEGT
ncbi:MULTISPECIES: exonuclease domain-containing protein [Pseudomonas]|jgi:inhibitor of KinA sporulation pathway (predicted exonuclease)|uniref:3'-5' exoribonuclease n=1 Tax=Pseudomonas urmiensis TaxID=2745493 RepID=A0A923G126_9PSED|nr:MULTISPECIES: exonuclease domain-containing protein [Pseudomonas]MBV4535261.1 3'-5' exoribonuclease [Pseudomonas urmiensis]